MHKTKTHTKFDPKNETVAFFIVIAIAIIIAFG